MDNNWEVVSLPYHKFFNFGEALAHPIDWNKAKVLQKIDGSLISIYNYQNKWLVATNGSPDASGSVDIYAFTFRELVDRAWHELNYQWPNQEDSHLTFMMELTSPYNRVVVLYPKIDLILHGVRNRETGEYYSPEEYSQKYGWHLIQSFPLTTMDEVVEAVGNLNGIQEEGYVVTDGVNRVKIKNPDYLRYAHMKEGVTPRSLLNTVVTGEGSEMLAYFPQYGQLFNNIKERYDKLAKEVDAYYEEVKGIESQKDFALKIKDVPYSSVLFIMRKFNSDAKTAMLRTNVRTLEQWTNLKEIDFGSLGEEQ